MASKFDNKKFIGFDWDSGNIDKNKNKHNVTYKECEEVFTNVTLMIFEDGDHSKKENRFGAFGKTNIGRKLTIFYTVRNGKIRIISARDQSKKERNAYNREENKQKER